jgi:hypothetical protein
MPVEDDDALGRRRIDQFAAISPEVMHVLLLQLQQTLIEFKADFAKDLADLKLDFSKGMADMQTEMRAGFSSQDQRFKAVEDRAATLERFRERVEARDKALAESEGRFSMSWQAIAALLTVVSLVVGVIVALLGQLGHM